MVTEKGKEAELPETPQPQQETQAPTAEEQLKTLQSQVQALTAEKERLEGGYKGLQRTLEERNRETKKQQDLDSRIEGLQDTMELLATAVSARGEVDNLEPEKRQDVLAQLKKQREVQEAKRKQVESQQSQSEYAQRADVVYNEAQALLKDSDDPEQLIEIRDFLVDGKIDRAQARLNKLKGQKSTTTKPTETEEQRIERLVEEKHKKYLQERGLLEEFSSQPSARSSSWAETERKYAAGEISTTEYSKARAKEGII